MDTNICKNPSANLRRRRNWKRNKRKIRRRSKRERKRR
jgi:hypothetical protein